MEAHHTWQKYPGGTLLLNVALNVPVVSAVLQTPHLSSGSQTEKCVNFRTEILYLFSLNVLRCLKFNISCCKKSAFMFQFHLGIILKFHRVFSTSEKTKNILNLNLSFLV